MISKQCIYLTTCNRKMLGKTTQTYGRYVFKSIQAKKLTMHVYKSEIRKCMLTKFTEKVLIKNATKARNINKKQINRPLIKISKLK